MATITREVSTPTISHHQLTTRVRARAQRRAIIDPTPRAKKTAAIPRYINPIGTIIRRGGAPEDFERALPILQICGKKIIHVGPVGAGHAIKVLTNSIMGATVWITCECLLLAKRFGIDIKTALEVTNAGSGRSNASENLLPMRLVEGKWPLVFKLLHHDKDIRIAATIAHQQHASTPMLALTQHLFTASLNQLGDQADYIEVAKVIAELNDATWE
jgi:3-hydroxyisobutyrate dehydrogenase